MSKNGLEVKPHTSSTEPSESTPLIVKNNDAGEEGAPPESPDSITETIEKGLSENQSVLLIACEMAGGGVLALPRVLVRTGWVGVPLIITLCAAAAFSAKRLSDCWAIAEKREPQLRTEKRNPCVMIANIALGPFWSVLVSLAMMITLFGTSIVYLLMATQIVEQVLLSLVPTTSYCLWYLIVTLVVTPLTIFGTPKDFAITGVITFGSAILACILYFIQMMADARPFVFRWGIHGFQDFFLAFGTVMFAFGSATFPTIQNDMHDKTKYDKSVNYSFFAILCLYLTIAIAGYAVYGEAVAPNVATSLSPTALTLVANVLMAIHLIFAYIILITPLYQEAEELYEVSTESTKWRMGVRLSIMLAILFVGESIPRFHTLLSLIGGTSVALLTYVFPSYCYLKLNRSAVSLSGEAQSSETPGWMKMLCKQVIAVSVIGGVAVTISAVAAIFSTAMVMPCYFR